MAMELMNDIELDGGDSWCLYTEDGSVTEGSERRNDIRRNLPNIRRQDGSHRGVLRQVLLATKIINLLCFPCACAEALNKATVRRSCSLYSNLL